jgi:hypothetical protein
MVRDTVNHIAWNLLYRSDAELQSEFLSYGILPPYILDLPPYYPLPETALEDQKGSPRHQDPNPSSSKKRGPLLSAGTFLATS